MNSFLLGCAEIASKDDKYSDVVGRDSHAQNAVSSMILTNRMRKSLAIGVYGKLSFHVASVRQPAECCPGLGCGGVECRTKISWYSTFFNCVFVACSFRAQRF